VRLGDIDEVTLDISATLLLRLDAAQDVSARPGAAQSEDEEADDDTVTGPIAIAVDLAEPDLSPAPSDPPAL